MLPQLHIIGNTSTRLSTETCNFIGLLGAALRLGIIGHIDSQAILGRLHPVIEDILSAPPVALHEMHAYAPAADIAMMRHETQESRLFYN